MFTVVILIEGEGTDRTLTLKAPRGRHDITHNGAFHDILLFFPEAEKTESHILPCSRVEHIIVTYCGEESGVLGAPKDKREQHGT